LVAEPAQLRALICPKANVLLSIAPSQWRGGKQSEAAKITGRGK
jgi:hypothetical protein